MAKTAIFGLMHVGIAFSVGYAFTGSLTVAGAMTLVEPLCNMVAHYFFDRWWDGRSQRQAPGAGGSASAAGGGAARGAMPQWG